MIRLKNIVIKDGTARCDIFPEGSTEVGVLEIDIESGNIKNYYLPKGYEWCDSHLQHALAYLIELLMSNDEIPKEKTIMWY